MQAIPDSDFIHVVIGIVKNTENEVLVTKRSKDAHLGGLLEFPGGKLEAKEFPKTALRRELKEELNIDLHQCVPLIQISYSYPDRNVFLDVYTVTDFSGSVSAHESQELDWKEISTLNSVDFPNANYGIIRALQMPRIISVTPNLNQDPDNFMRCFEKVVINDDISIIQLRSHDANHSQYMQLAEKCLKLCTQYQVKLILNRKATCLKELKAAGLHLTSKRLLAARKRPLEKDFLVGASCHSFDEIRHASKLDLDYVFLGPVVEKNSNTNINPLGWDSFATLTQQSLIPVYAIGGLAVSDIDTAVEHGGQGIAAIRDLWTI